MDWNVIWKKKHLADRQQPYLACVYCFVYFLLAAQYESYILPLAVILSVPVGILGVLLAVNMAGLENNIYVQVAMVMLIGLLAKNAILIIEYAVQRRKAGMTLVRFSILKHLNSGCVRLL